MAVAVAEVAVAVAEVAVAEVVEAEAVEAVVVAVPRSRHCRIRPKESARDARRSAVRRGRLL